MGAGQIGGIATLLNIDFSNSAGFEGSDAQLIDGHFIAYYLSHAMVFCVGAILEAHVILTPASCVFGERHKFEVFAGTHTFLENVGTSRLAHHVCLHRGYNQTRRWESCFTDNMALIVVGEQFNLDKREPNSQFTVGRLRYGIAVGPLQRKNCEFFGWGSRRNGYLLPLLINLRHVKVKLLASSDCKPMWNYADRYICIETPMCKNAKYGALCPDDLGTMLVCDGFLQGMLTSRLVDRPCGVGFVDMDKYLKFITCGIDDSREVIAHEEVEIFNSDMYTNPTKASLITLPGQYIDINHESVTVKWGPDQARRFDDKVIID